jgi:hypothetical protein
MMELKNELEKIIKYLSQSKDSIYANKSVFEINESIKAIINKINNENKIEINIIKMLIAPTGSLQEISIDNGWGEEFIKITNEIEKIMLEESVIPDPAS